MPDVRRSCALDALYEEVLSAFEEALDKVEDTVSSEPASNLRNTKTWLENATSSLISWSTDARTEAGSLSAVEGTLLENTVRSTLHELQGQLEEIYGDCNLTGNVSSVTPELSPNHREDTLTADENSIATMSDLIGSLQETVRPIRMIHASRGQGGPYRNLKRQIDNIYNHHIDQRNPSDGKDLSNQRDQRKRVPDLLDASTARIPKPAQTEDSTIGVVQEPKTPLMLSKSSIPGHSLDSRPTTPASHRSSVPPYISATSSMTSIPSTFSKRSLPRSPGSYTSHISYYSHLSQQSLILPQRIMQTLPPEIYDTIIYQLKEIHKIRETGSCQTCLLRDLCALSSTSRAWDKAVVKVMYDRIELVGHDSKDNIRKLKIKVGIRLRLLRRTLRGRLFLAQHVRVLKVPRLYVNIIPKDYMDLVASLIMACPNLEKLEDFYPIYNHEFSRLIYALSTRRRLVEQIWLIGKNAAITARSQRQLAPGLMDLEQKSSFVHYHSSWNVLTTLFLYSPNQGILEKDIFINMNNDTHPQKIKGLGILQRLPSLQNLCIANFDMDDFDDFTLQHLPPLKSLRLQDLEGITFWGLSEFSRTKSAIAIRNLSLVNLDITYISAISNLCLHLKNLKRFTLVQDTSPEVTPGEVIFQPLIASHQLEYLHWDIVVPGSAYDNLASSIRTGGFPRLHTIRAPSDRYGQIQALCKPRASIEIPSDWSSDTPQRSLREARRAAQQRLEEAWSTVHFKVVVEGGGVVHEIYDLNGFMGTVGSKIQYNLEPDIPGSDQALIDFPDVVGGMEETGGKDVCTGAWNAGHPAGANWWQHTARPRYTSVDLMKFF